jgi:hypothetical protein
MNKKLLNIGRAFTVLALSTFALTACDTDTDSNPTFQANTEGFQLNVPANATNNTYDLASADGLNLTCKQPDYGGFPVVVDYYVQVSLESSFSSFRELETFYKTASMNVDAMEINNAMLGLFTEAYPDDAYPDEARALYVRLRAVVDGQEQLGETYSNIITLPNVLATYVPPTLELPTSLYIVGSSIGGDDEHWSYWKKMAPVYGGEGEFYTIVYFPDGAQFKWGESEGDWRGYSAITTIDDQANAGVAEAASDGNIQVANGGWYTLHVESEVSTNNVKYTFHFYPAAAYVIGEVEGGSWTQTDDNWAMVAPADATGLWVSPAFAASGELRAYIYVKGRDWWKTEFTLYNGSLYWRTINVATSWATDAGSEFSVACSAGQKLYVDFNKNTGEVK